MQVDVASKHGNRAASRGFKSHFAATSDIDAHLSFMLHSNQSFQRSHLLLPPYFKQSQLHNCANS